MIGVFRTGRWTSLVVTALALVLCLSTWFSATSVAPTLVSTLNLQEADEIWLTNAVQAGFVFGVLLSSFLSISDAFNVSRVMSVGAFFAALTNLLLIAAIDPWHAIAARFLTGCALAFVYPPDCISVLALVDASTGVVVLQNSHVQVHQYWTNQAQRASELFDGFQQRGPPIHS